MADFKRFLIYSALRPKRGIEQLWRKRMRQRVSDHSKLIWRQRRLLEQADVFRHLGSCLGAHHDAGKPGLGTGIGEAEVDHALALQTLREALQDTDAALGKAA